MDTDWLDDATSHSSAEGGTELTEQQAGEGYPLVDLDQDIFTDEWRAGIEALDCIDEPQLYDTEDGFVPADWEHDQAAMEQTLQLFGLDEQRLAHQQGEEVILVGQICAHMGLSLNRNQLEWHRRRFVELVRAAVSHRPIAKRLRGDHLSAEAQRIRDAGTHGNRQQINTKPILERDTKEPPQPGNRLERWKTRVGPAGTRDEQEAADQREWAQQTIRILEKASAPVIELAKESIDPTAVLRGAIGGTRGSTMECYTKAIRPLLEWLHREYKLDWPSKVIEFIDFLHLVGNKPCSPSFPKRLQQSLAWFEKVGNWDEGERISKHELVNRTVAFWSEELRSGVKPLRQAVRYTWQMMAALELFVMNYDLPKHLRFRAWTMLVKAWGTLRQDDIQHLQPGKLRQQGEALIAELMRSKTSGASKRVRELPISLWLGATITRSLWWEAGLALMSELTEKANDFLLPAFTAGGMPIQRPMGYIEASGLSRMVLSKLQVPVYLAEKEEWANSDQNLIPEPIVTMWTEHSGRPVLPSSAQLLGFKKTECDFLGRWSPGGSADYSRAFRQATQSIQERVCMAVVSADEKLFEFEVLDRIGTWAEERDVSSEVAGLVKAEVERSMKEFWNFMKLAKSGQPPCAPLPETKPPEVVAKPLKIDQKRSTRPGFVIVYSRDRKKAKLHRAGGCPWTKVTLADSQDVSNPSPDMYSSRCKLCWPMLADKQAELEIETFSEESDM